MNRLWKTRVQYNEDPLNTYIATVYYVFNSFLLTLTNADSPVEINKDEIEMIEGDFSRAYWPWQLPNAARKKMNKVRK